MAQPHREFLPESVVRRSEVRILRPHHLLQFLDRPGRLPRVQHRVTIGTYWPKIGDGIDLVLVANAGQFPKVMDVNEVFAD